ncbi:MAG: ABC transporter ATP-binding protein [Oscillospiraceae bacterium]|nr:ABC transporter ATP-binding protein [Oscillospiraceae bacterium]
MRNNNNKTKTRTLSRLIRYISPFSPYLILGIVLTIASNALALVGPYLSGLAIGCIEPGIGKVEFKALPVYLLLMAVFYILSGILSYALSKLMINTSRKIIFKMRGDIFDKLQTLPVGYFDTHPVGDILSRISYDTDTINTSLSTDVVHVFAGIITVIGSLAMMIYISPRLTLIFAITVPLTMVLVKLITGKTRPLFRARSKKLGELNGFVEEMSSGQKTIRAYNREADVIDRFSAKNDETVTAYYKAEYYGGVVGPSVNFMNNLSLSLVSVFGAALYLKQLITIANISSFVLYSRKFSGPINEIANIISELQSTLSAAERVFALLDEEPEPIDCAGMTEAENIRGEVELSDVSFGYTPETTVIKNLSLNVKSGDLVAIVGPTGAGKTTLVNLLMRFYDINSGSIRIDGTDVSEITRKSMRLAYSMVLQDTWLFHGTVFDNIAYGKEGATREDVERACRDAGIHDYILTLPQGYDTILIDGGTNISKGQKQLLTIARAMLADAKLLILDEATSNVDTRTEKQIQKTMRKLMDGKTCFVIAHRLSTVRDADVILVVKDGNIIESGTHDELIAKNGFYKEMFDSQFI